MALEPAEKPALQQIRQQTEAVDGQTITRQLIADYLEIFFTCHPFLVVEKRNNKMGRSAAEERAGMNVQPISMDKQIDEEDLILFSLEELEAFFVQRICPALEKTFHTVSRSARTAAQTEAQKLVVIESETHFKQALEELKATIHAYIYHAIFTEHDERKLNLREKWR